MVAAAQNVGKITLLFSIFLFFTSNIIKANTKYYMLEEETEQYQLFKYDLSTKALYGIDRKITLFNLILKERRWANDVGEYYSVKVDNPNLILFSSLPDLNGNSDWIEVSLDTIKNDLVTTDQLIHVFNENIISMSNEKNKSVTKYFNSYKPIVKKGNHYFVPKNSLLEFYVVSNRPEVFANPYGTINTQLSPLTIVEFKKIFKKTYQHDIFPLDKIWEDKTFTYFDKIRDRREYMSRSLTVAGGATAFQFWTYTDWYGKPNSYIYDRGIDRFVYLPSKGIIGGSFDFYFYFNRSKLPITSNDFLQNIKEEKVMIADIYK